MAGVVFGALAMTTLAVGVAYWIGALKKEQPIPVPQSLPTDVHQQLSGYTFTRSDGGRRIFTVRAARTVAFRQGGTTVLEDVMVDLFGRTGGRHDILRTQRCEYNPKSGDLFSSGKVQIELNAQSEASPGAGLKGKQPAYLETSKVAFRHQGSLVVTDEPVKFRLGPASGTARGLTYATTEDWLELEKEVAMEFQPSGGAVPQPSVHLAASRVRYEKGSGVVSLWGPVEIIQGTRRVVAQRGTVSLNERNRVTRFDLEDSARASDASEGRSVAIGAQRIHGEFDPASGELRRLVAETGVSGELEEKGSVGRLAAQRLELSLAGQHPRPELGVATGDVRVYLESPPTGVNPGPGREESTREKKTLTAAQVRFTFRPNQASLKDAETVGPGKLVVIPVDPKVGARVITAGQFLMDFDSQSRLEALHGRSPTRILFQPPEHAAPGSVAQESSADRLEASFDPATQTLQEVQQVGNFQFRDGERQGSAQEARYVAQTQKLALTGHPVVWDPRSRVKCDRIYFDLGNDVAEGEGKVQGTQVQSADPGPPARPSEPTNILADRMVAGRRSQLVHYEGHVRAWHGSEVVESSALDVYRSERRLSSGSQVLTSHLQPASLAGPSLAAPASPSRETRPVTVRADLLDYLDQGRKASYRGNVRLQTENTTLQADRMDVYFSGEGSPEESQIERAVAEGHVQVVQPGRRANGEHGEYFAKPGKIVMTGGPPTLDDAEKGFTTGQRLTFFIHDDRLFVDGGGDLPTLSRHRVAQ
jgi:lipopolysaccharide export system protein LptA